MQHTTDHSHIQGWGADLDPKNRPAVPKEKKPKGGTGAHWSKPEPQASDVKILKSVEHFEMPPVFGTSTPPKGASGLMRSLAFRFSENDVRHWLILLFADRVNMIEGVFEDLAKGHVPNIFAEMGLPSELKHNRKAVTKKLMIMGGIASAIAVAVIFRPKKSTSRKAARQVDVY